MLTFISYGAKIFKYEHMLQLQNKTKQTLKLYYFESGIKHRQLDISSFV